MALKTQGRLTSGGDCVPKDKRSKVNENNPEPPALKNDNPKKNFPCKNSLPT